MTYVGIDPGLSGSVCFLVGDSVALYEMPTESVSATRREISVKQVSALLDDLTDADLVTIEDVGTNPAFGAQRAFNFGKGFGALLAVLEMKNLRVLRVGPKVWKKVMLAGTDQSKEAAVKKVNDLYGLSLGKTEHDKAEALLIALYGKEKHP